MRFPTNSTTTTTTTEAFPRRPQLLHLWIHRCRFFQNKVERVHMANPFSDHRRFGRTTVAFVRTTDGWAIEKKYLFLSLFFSWIELPKLWKWLYMYIYSICIHEYSLLGMSSFSIWYWTGEVSVHACVYDSKNICTITSTMRDMNHMIAWIKAVVHQEARDDVAVGAPRFSFSLPDLSPFPSLFF